MCSHEAQLVILGFTNVFDMRAVAAKYDPDVQICNLENPISVLFVGARYEAFLRWAPRTYPLFGILQVSLLAHCENIPVHPSRMSMDPKDQLWGCGPTTRKEN